MNKIIVFPGNNALTDTNRLGYFLLSTFASEQVAPRANRRMILSKSSCIGSPEVTVLTGECRVKGKMGKWMGPPIELFWSVTTLRGQITIYLFQLVL